MVIVVVSIFAIIIFNGTRSRSDPSTTESSMSSCEELRSSEVRSSRDLLKANLLGVITATASELRDVQAELNAREIERRAKEPVLETQSAHLTDEVDATKDAQRELTERDAEVKEIQSDLNAKIDELRVAETANDIQENIDTLTKELVELRLRSEFLANRITTLTERIVEHSKTTGSLTESVTVLHADIAILDADIDTLTRREAALEATFEAKYLARSAMLAPEARATALQRVRSELDVTRNELGPAEAVADELPLLEELIDEIRLLDLMEASLSDPIWFLASGLEDDISGAYLPPRSDVNLVPDAPVSRINLGSHRTTSKVEIILATASFGAADSSSTAAQDGVAAAIPNVALPDKAEFFTEVGQFDRSEGGAIPPEQISVWARRVDTFVIVSVCIEPDGLHPGMYAGDVYLVDPSLSPTRVHVEVTAQSQWINFLYLLLILLPALALAYVWITARYSAGQDPWKGSHWWAWFRQNSVAVLVVGFAAVWATLQVPFNNPTWGTSWLTSAAVIGVGLVAAVTAMTVVAGRVVADRQSDDDPDDGAEADRSEAVSDKS